MSRPAPRVGPPVAWGYIKDVPDAPNTLYYGDNLDILRRYVDDESVDLIYLDPPFNSDADYNVLFAEKSGEKAHSQIKAFTDTWTWDTEAAAEYAEVLRSGHDRVARALKGIHDFLGGNDMLAYLSMMALRLIELRRVLKPTGSIYLHCDPTASHYLKLIIDGVFGPGNFRNEIIWRRTGAHSASKRWNEVHDVILFATASDSYLWNKIELPHTEEYAGRFKRLDETGKAWTDDNLTAPGVRNGDSGAVWRGYDVTARGVHWKSNSKTVEGLVGKAAADELSTTQKLDLLDQHGFILWPKKSAVDGGGFPRFKRYLSGGQLVQDVISDIPPLNSQAQERLGYPTQKPEALLERIIQASSNEGDVVLDPFCGCGTSIAAAQRLNRRWIGIDITHLAVNLIKVRLADAFVNADPPIKSQYRVIGEPTDLAGARALAEQDKYQFQFWALGLIDARPAPADEKKGADKGIDARLYLTDAAGETATVIVSVKGGHVTASQVRDLRGVIEREKAAVGVFLTLEPPTAPMRKEAADAGVWQTRSVAGTRHPRLQLITVQDLLDGHRLDLPAQQSVRSFKQAPKQKKRQTQQPDLF